MTEKEEFMSLMEKRPELRESVLQILQGLSPDKSVFSNKKQHSSE